MAAADDLSLEYCAHFYSCGEIAEGLKAFQENFGTSSSKVFRISESCFNFRTVFWTSEPQLSSTIILYSISNIYISISRRIEFARADRKMLFPMLRFIFFQYVTSMIRKIRNVSSRSLSVLRKIRNIKILKIVSTLRKNLSPRLASSTIYRFSLLFF